MTRLYGRAPRGHRVIGGVPKNWGHNVTMLAALSTAGVDPTMTIEGATDTDVFCAYVSDVLSPTLMTGDIVVMDNLSAHKAQRVRQLIEARGARLV